MTLRQITETEATFTIECRPEDVPVRGNVLASGDDALDKRDEDAILAKLDVGNTWAWCTVRVVATWNGFEGEAFLGCCS